MPKKVTIYHNPRCSKSRQTLELLNENGHEPEVVEYLKDAPSAEELREVIAMLGVKAHDIVRTKEPEYQETGLTPDSYDDEVIQALVNYPKLLERPIVVCNGKAAIGRPPEKILDIL